MADGQKTEDPPQLMVTITVPISPYHFSRCFGDNAFGSIFPFWVDAGVFADALEQADPELAGWYRQIRQARSGAEELWHKCRQEDWDERRRQWTDWEQTDEEPPCDGWTEYYTRQYITARPELVARFREIEQLRREALVNARTKLVTVYGAPADFRF